MKERIIYSKYSNERRAEFAIRTDICMCGEKKCVKKSALDPIGQLHLESIFNHYQMLQDVYRNSNLAVNLCEKKSPFLVFEYLEGSTLEEFWDGLLHEGRLEELESSISEYLEEVKSLGKKKKFSVTPQFTEVFGGVNFSEELDCTEITNIDMVANNVILGPQKTLIDYEWTFDFPIPLNYVIYRILHYYLNSSSTRTVVKQYKDWYEFMDISEEERGAYEKMEAHFQSYILGKYVPLRYLYHDITPGSVSVGKTVESYQYYKCNQIQVFWSKDGIIREKDSVFCMARENSISEKIDFPQGVACVRVDPGENSCLISLEILEINGKSLELTKIKSNGKYAGKKYWLFEKEDPNFYISDVGEIQNMEIKLKVLPIREETADLFCQQTQTIEELQEYIQVYRKKLEQLQKELKISNEKISVIEETKVWKLYRNYRNLIERK